MSRLMITSDLHLGHKNIHKFRSQFKTAEEHHEFVFENLAMNINKADSLILLGDIAFTDRWLYRLEEIRCKKKTLILGNHDTDQGISIGKLATVFDSIHSLHSKRNIWFSHCPIHPDQFRGKAANIHGHLHDQLVRKHECGKLGEKIDPRYINVCVEHTNYKPAAFADLI